MKTTKNRFKKAFTIVELVIVVAIIAVLSAVMLPTIIGLVDKANKASDLTLVSNLNTSLSIAGEPDKVTVENKDSENVSVYNVTTAITSVRGSGYDVSKLTPTADGGDIVYNASTNKFLYYAEDFTDLAYGDKPSADDVLVVMDTDLTRVGIAETVLTDNTIQYCVYSENGVDISTDKEINIWLYTERGTTTVTAANATIDYFGTADVIDITEVKGDSFHMYGTVESLSVTKGHVELKSTSKTSSLKIMSSNVKLTIVKGAEYEEVAALNGVSYSLYTKENDDAESQAATDIETTLAEMMGEGSTFISTLTLSENTTMDSALTVSAGVNKVIDLNGYELTITGTSDSSHIINNGTLTITDSSTAKNGSLDISSANYGITNNGTLTIEGGTITGNKCAVYVTGGTVSMSGGEITGQVGVYLNNSSASLYMTGGTITATDTITKTGTYAMCIGIYAKQSKEIFVTGGTIDVADGCKGSDVGSDVFSCAIYINNTIAYKNGNLTVSNTTITSIDAGINYTTFAQNDYPTVTISGNSEISADGYAIYSKNCSVMIIDGTYSGNITMTGTETQTAGLTISGGTFNGVTLTTASYGDFSMTGSTLNGVNFVLRNNTSSTIAISDCNFYGTSIITSNVDLSSYFDSDSESYSYKSEYDEDSYTYTYTITVIS